MVTELIEAEWNKVFINTSDHHAAFDKFFLGIRPDGIVIVRKDVLLESDGPMLRHGLQGLHNKKILFPRKAEFRPSPDLLERRWQRFKDVA